METLASSSFHSVPFFLLLLLFVLVSVVCRLINFLRGVQRNYSRAAYFLRVSEFEDAEMLLQTSEREKKVRFRSVTESTRTSRRWKEIPSREIF